MAISLRLAFTALGVGSVLGLIVLSAAAAAGRGWRLPTFLSGAAWGILCTALILTDCLPGVRGGPLSDLAFPAFYLGLFLFPVRFAWKQERWWLKYFAAQLVVLLAAGPAFIMAVAAALCVMA